MALISGRLWRQADGKGVDAGATKPEDCIDAARVIGSSYGSVVTITGPSDAIVESGGNERVCFVQDGDGGPDDKGKVRFGEKD